METTCRHGEVGHDAQIQRNRAKLAEFGIVDPIPSRPKCAQPRRRQQKGQQPSRSSDRVRSLHLAAAAMAAVEDALSERNDMIVALRAFHPNWKPALLDRTVDALLDALIDPADVQAGLCHVLPDDTILVKHQVPDLAMAIVMRKPAPIQPGGAKCVMQWAGSSLPHNKAITQHVCPTSALLAQSHVRHAQCHAMPCHNPPCLCCRS